MGSPSLIEHSNSISNLYFFLESFFFLKNYISDGHNYIFNKILPAQYLYPVFTCLDDPRWEIRKGSKRENNSVFFIIYFYVKSSFS